jgi:hypothetical protein
VLSITKRCNSATPVICRTAKLLWYDQTYSREAPRHYKRVGPLFGEP